MFGPQFNKGARYFDGEFAALAREVAAPPAALAELGDFLKERGWCRESEEMASRFFREHGAHWPRYENWCRTREWRDEPDGPDPSQLDLAGALCTRKMEWLRRFHTAVTGSPARARAKADLASQVARALEERGMAATVLGRERTRLSAEWAAAHAETRWREMGFLFCHRLMMKVYKAEDLHSRRSLTHTRPYWQFSAIVDDRTPSECAALDGLIRRHDDAFWADCRIPCERLFCRCSILCLTAREAAERGAGGT